MAADRFARLPADEDEKQAPPLYKNRCVQCCSTCCCIMLVSLLLVVMWVVPGALWIWMSMLWCRFWKCINIFDSQRAAHCQDCMATFKMELAMTPVGVNGVPLGYFVAPLRLFDENDLQSTVYTEWDDVWRYGSALPEKVWSGEWWRGNELGFIVNNPYFWSLSGIYPYSNSLGSLPSQHASIRPFLEDAFNVTEAASAFVRSSVRKFLAERRAAGEINIQVDLQTWVHQVLYHQVFHKDLKWGSAVEVISAVDGEKEFNSVMWEMAENFTTVQSGFVSLGTVSQAFPALLYKLGFAGIGKVRAAANEYISKYISLIEQNKDWSERLAKLDCSPSTSCTVQLASGLWDAFYSAGGLSVPGGISTGLGILYSTSASNPVKDFVIPRGKELEFFWESIRLFAPVFGFPYWQPRPTCVGTDAKETSDLNRQGGKTGACPEQSASWLTGFSPVNQWQEGERKILFVGAAQRDKKRWGANADDFVLRPLQEYEHNSVGFAEMAVDKAVPANSRLCPAKELALLIGNIFFEEFDQGAWKPEDSNINLAPGGSITQVSSFKLVPVPEVTTLRV